MLTLQLHSISQLTVGFYLLWFSQQIGKKRGAALLLSFKTMENQGHIEK